mmetsp:Transcript_81101/g.173439  ORF Transcript_81101/g.173439 Transcript_81101/m.173439 type:complete len:222 (-) Transcript_81101:160-825(-)
MASSSSSGYTLADPRSRVAGQTGRVGRIPSVSKPTVSSYQSGSAACAVEPEPLPQLPPLPGYPAKVLAKQGHEEGAMERTVTLVGDEDWAPVLLHSLFRPTTQWSDDGDSDSSMEKEEKTEYVQVCKQALMSLLPQPTNTKRRFISDPTVVLQSQARQASEAALGQATSPQALRSQARQASEAACGQATSPRALPRKPDGAPPMHRRHTHRSYSCGSAGVP